jgi:hypothetical protein
MNGNKMERVRIVLGMICGLTVGFSLMALLEMLGHIVYPPPSDIDFQNLEMAKEVIRGPSTGELIFLIFSYAVTSFVAGFITRLISKDSAAWPVFGVTGALLGVASSTILHHGHPTWFVVIGLFIFIPSAGLGSELMMNLRKKFFKK